MAIRIDPDIVIHKYVKNRVASNKNWLGVICGATGSGKSYFSLAVCERHFPRFTVDNIVFSVKEYLDLFTECRAGDIIVFDEGEEWNARRAMEQKNVEFGNILSMIRATQISSIFTLPDIRQIDVTLVRLMHNYIYTMDIDRKTCPLWQRRRTGVNFYEIIKEKLPQGSTRDLKVRYPVMDVIIRNNTTQKYYEKSVKIKELWYKSPAAELLEQYEAVKKRHFNSALLAARNRLKMRDLKDNQKAMQAEGKIPTGITPDPDSQAPIGVKAHTPPVSVTPEMQAASLTLINKIIAHD